jgi:hypothetical protein
LVPSGVAVRLFQEPNTLASIDRAWTSRRRRPITEKKSEKIPAAGPHAKPELTDADKTPGAGTLPPADKGPDEDSTAG